MMKISNNKAKEILDVLRQNLSFLEIEKFIIQRKEDIKLFLKDININSLSLMEAKGVDFLAKRYRAYWLRKISMSSQIGKLDTKSLDELRQVSKDLQECVSAMQPLWKWLQYQDLPRLRYQELAVKALVLKREKKSHLQVASLWRKASHELRRNASLWPRLGKVPNWAVPFRENCLYEANILEGFHFLARVPVDLPKAIRKLKIALHHAEASAKYYPALKQNVNYVSYWLGVFLLRQRILTNRWEEARRTVHIVRESALKASIFAPDEFRPHYYLGVNDIENEQFLIDAMASLKSKDLNGAIEKLQNWLKVSEIYFGTWRYANVKVRERALDILARALAGARIDDQQLKQIRKLIKKWQPGNTCKRIHKLVSKAARSWNKSREVATILTAIAEIEGYMSLDIWMESKEPNEEEYRTIPLDYLPPQYSQRLESCFSMLTDLKNPRFIAQRLRSIVASYLAVMAEYYIHQGSSVDVLKSKLFGRLDKALSSIPELISLIKILLPRVSRTLDSLNAKMTNTLEEATIAKVEDALTYFRDDVIPETFGIYPLVVQISALEKQVVKKTQVLNFYRARRLQKLSGETPFIMICGYQSLLLRNFYYLPPNWKKQQYQRASYPLFRPKFSISKGLIYRRFERHEYIWSGWQEWRGNLNELRKEIEGPQLEFKGPAESQLIECLMGLGNAQGGHVVIGISNKFSSLTDLRDIYGVSPKKAEQILNGLATGNRQIKPHPILYDCFFKPVGRSRKAVLIIYVYKAITDQEEPYHTEKKVAFREGASTQTYDVIANAENIKRLWKQNR